MAPSAERVDAGAEKPRRRESQRHAYAFEFISNFCVSGVQSSSAGEVRARFFKEAKGGAGDGSSIESFDVFLRKQKRRSRGRDARVYRRGVLLLALKASVPRESCVRGRV